MLRLIAVVLILATGYAVAEPSNVIQSRKALMRDNAAQIKVERDMRTGERPFDLNVAKKAIETLRDNSGKIVALFPDGSDVGDTKALPMVWGDKGQFSSAAARLKTKADEQLPKVADLASFQKAMIEVGSACSGCHTVFRNNR